MTGIDNEQFVLEELKKQDAKNKKRTEAAKRPAPPPDPEDDAQSELLSTISLSDTLPTVPDGYQSMPNIFAISECFPSYRSRQKKFIENKIVSRNASFELEYVKGEQMDDRDEDLILKILFLYTRCQVPFDKPLRMKTSDFISAIGRVSGGSAYQFTLKRLEVLKNATFAITTNDFTMNEGIREYFNVLRELQIADGWITLKLDPRWLYIYRTDQILFIYYQTRSILRSPHAKVIHKLLCIQSSSRQYISEDQLIRSLGWDGQRIRDMWKAVTRAMDELVEKRIVVDYEITVSRRGAKQLAIAVNQNVLKPGLYRNITNGKADSQTIEHKPVEKTDDEE